MQQADVVKTHGDNTRVLKLTNFKNFTDVEIGLKNTIEWYKSYNSLK